MFYAPKTPFPYGYSVGNCPFRNRLKQYNQPPNTQDLLFNFVYVSIIKAPELLANISTLIFHLRQLQLNGKKTVDRFTQENNTKITKNYPKHFLNNLSNININKYSLFHNLLLNSLKFNFIQIF